ncbi:hypothetical protein NN561_010901 [Cricetulus griseus]
MERRQYKNTSNNRKTNITPPESRDSIPARHEHPNTDEAEESNIKNNFMQMIETLTEEIRQSSREMEEKTNQKMQENKESQENTIKQLKETVQDLKTEIETIKKTQTEGMLEVEKLSKQSGTTDANITNRIQEMEDRISDAEDKLKEINSSSKENLKSKKSLRENIQEIWDTMKRPNLRITGKKLQGKCLRIIFTESPVKLYCCYGVIMVLSAAVISLSVALSSSGLSRALKQQQFPSDLLKEEKGKKYNGKCLRIISIESSTKLYCCYVYAVIMALIVAVVSLKFTLSLSGLSRPFKQQQFHSDLLKEEKFEGTKLQGKCLRIISVESPVKLYCCYGVMAVLFAAVLSLSVALKLSGRPVTEKCGPCYDTCPKDWIGFGSKCFHFYEDMINWTSSQTSCMELEAHLAIFESIEELVGKCSDIFQVVLRQDFTSSAEHCVISTIILRHLLVKQLLQLDGNCSTGKKFKGKCLRIISIESSTKLYCCYAYAVIMALIVAVVAVKFTLSLSGKKLQGKCLRIISAESPVKLYWCYGVIAVLSAAVLSLSVALSLSGFPSEDKENVAT